MNLNHQLQPNGRVKFVLSEPQQTGKGITLCINGEYANINMYGVLMSMFTNYMNDPAYIVNQKARGFFQSGSNDPKSSFYMVEFWTDDREAIQLWLNEFESRYVHDFDMARKALEDERKKLDHVAELYDFRKELHSHAA